jgi:hypothetical protein
MKIALKLRRMISICTRSLASRSIQIDSTGIKLKVAANTTTQLIDLLSP